MIYWAPVLHFYQPPTQFPAVLKRVCQESYRPLIDLLGEFTRARATVNINGALTEMLLDSGHEDVINGLRHLATAGRIELLISNRISFQSIDGFGFIEHLRSLGRAPESMYVVTAMDAETFGHHIREWERLFLAHVYAQLDIEPAPEEHVEIEQSVSLAQQHRAVLASTAEGLGPNLCVVTVSDLFKQFPFGPPVTPKASSWSASGEDLARGVPYPLWNEPGNDIHQLLWRHLRLCMDLVDVAGCVAVQPEAKRHADIARGLLDRALHSCQFWWASRRPMWDMNMIERGLAEQRAVVLNAVKAIRVTKPDATTLTKADDGVMLSEGIARRLIDRLLA